MQNKILIKSMKYLKLHYQQQQQQCTFPLSLSGLVELAKKNVGSVCVFMSVRIDLCFEGVVYRKWNTQTHTQNIIY